MNRDLHPELGAKQRFEDFEAVVDAVRAVWATAYAEGSTGPERSWWVRDGSGAAVLVGHSWPVRGSHEIWLRLGLAAPLTLDGQVPSNSWRNSS